MDATVRLCTFYKISIMVSDSSLCSSECPWIAGATCELFDQELELSDDGDFERCDRCRECEVRSGLQD